MRIILGLFFMMSFLCSESSLAQGNGVGGGGDSQESRVNDIREDILSWIKKGGSKALIFPPDITLKEYNKKMTELLQPKAVVVSFVEKDHDYDEEKQVVVYGKNKTCRGFLSRIDNRPNILCHISRFKSTTPSDQYRLIHHEYAGLGYLERNDGAASDYNISNQITDFLAKVRVSKLALVKNVFQSAEELPVKYMEEFELDIGRVKTPLELERVRGKVYFSFDPKTGKMLEGIVYFDARLSCKDNSHLTPGMYQLGCHPNYAPPAMFVLDEQTLKQSKVVYRYSTKRKYKENFKYRSDIKEKAAKLMDLKIKFSKSDFEKISFLENVSADKSIDMSKEFVIEAGKENIEDYKVSKFLYWMNDIVVIDM